MESYRTKIRCDGPDVAWVEMVDRRGFRLPLREPVEAVQWFKNGDHPRDYEPPTSYFSSASRKIWWDAQRGQKEGGVVRYFRQPAVPGERVCRCGRTMHDHGWIDEGETGITVCPGDFIVDVAIDKLQEHPTPTAFPGAEFLRVFEAVA